MGAVAEAAVVWATSAFVNKSDSCRVLPTRLLLRASRLKTFCMLAARDASSVHFAARLPMPSLRNKDEKLKAGDATEACSGEVSSHVSRAGGVEGRFAGTRLLQLVTFGYVGPGRGAAEIK